MPIEPKYQDKGVVKELRKDSVLDLIRNAEKSTEKRTVVIFLSVAGEVLLIGRTNRFLNWT